MLFCLLSDNSQLLGKLDTHMLLIMNVGDNAYIFANATCVEDKRVLLLF